MRETGFYAGPALQPETGIAARLATTEDHGFFCQRLVAHLIKQRIFSHIIFVRTIAVNLPE